MLTLETSFIADIVGNEMESDDSTKKKLFLGKMCVRPRSDQDWGHKNVEVLFHKSKRYTVMYCMNDEVSI